jgi:hypothetical protein
LQQPNHSRRTHLTSIPLLSDSAATALDHPQVKDSVAFRGSNCRAAYCSRESQFVEPPPFVRPCPLPTAVAAAEEQVPTGVAAVLSNTCSYGGQRFAGQGAGPRRDHTETTQKVRIHPPFPAPVRTWVVRLSTTVPKPTLPPACSSRPPMRDCAHGASRSKGSTEPEGGR